MRGGAASAVSSDCPHRPPPVHGCVDCCEWCVVGGGDPRGAPVCGSGGVGALLGGGARVGWRTSMGLQLCGPTEAPAVRLAALTLRELVGVEARPLRHCPWRRVVPRQSEAPWPSNSHCRRTRPGVCSDAPARQSAPQSQCLGSRRPPGTNGGKGCQATDCLPALRTT